MSKAISVQVVFARHVSGSAYALAVELVVASAGLMRVVGYAALGQLRAVASVQGYSNSGGARHVVGVEFLRGVEVFYPCSL